MVRNERPKGSWKIVSHFVPRTCTEIGEDGAPIGPERSSDGSTGLFGLLNDDDSPAGSECPSRSLEHYRESDAYVLLGAPGAGKTVSFRQEAGRSGGHYVTARDFITPGDRPEWRDTTLFIDGLDEMRAGVADGCTPLDAIRAKLVQLGRPRFRLSCREADWFGANDREHLKSVSRGGEVKVLRLDPLSEDAAREILAHQAGIEDTDWFIASARERGIDGLLANPQSLLMLAQAVSGGSWPETRMQTFELACRKLAREHNFGHQVAQRCRAPSDSELLDAAGRLCAVQLLTGRAGYDLLGDGSGSEYLGPQQVSGGYQATFRYVLQTRLFESPRENRVAPTHRQIAEFLAGRCLSQRIGRGLPVGRVLALVTGGDGGIVSEFRGLSAWLAAHGKTSRGEIIDRDPFGVVLYGDVRGFSREEKHRILECMHRETKKNPWLSSAVRMDSRFGDLATNDMEEEFRKILINPARDDDAQQRFVFIVLQSLAHGQVIGALSDLLMRTVRDEIWLPGVRRQALDTFIGYQEQDMDTDDLRVLLEDIHAGSVSDPDDELLGILLKELYPKVLSASDLLKYLKVPENPSLYGRYVSFWIRHLPESSTNTQLAELLDAITERFDQLRPVFHHSRVAFVDPGKLLARLLARFLETMQMPISAERLFGWLEIVLDERLRFSSETGNIKSWLSSHPNEYKEMIRIGMERCAKLEKFSHCMSRIEYRFRGVERPPDFGRWCLEQVISSDDAGIKEYLIRQVADLVYGHFHDEGLSREIVEKRLAGDRAILGAFTERLRSREYTDKQQQEMQQRTEEKDDAEKLSRQQCWCDEVRRHWAALRENRCKPGILHQLAKIYYGIYPYVEGDTPEKRLRDLFGDDKDLIEIVLEGLRGSVNRSDVPNAEEIIRIFKENRIYQMALPFLAGLEISGGPDGERQMRQAFAAYYTQTTAGYDNQPPAWYNSILESHADVAASVLIRLVRAEIGSGNEAISGLRWLRNSDKIARLVSISLLTTFPVRCSIQQLYALGTLLGTALRHCETAHILELTNRKLVSRNMNIGQHVYWLITGVLASNSAESYRKRLEEYVSGNERRIRYLMTFVDRLADCIYPEYIRDLDTPALQLLVKLMGSSYGPAIDPLGFNSRSRLIREFINKLATLPSPEATQSLESLSDDDALRSWKPYLVDALDRQNSVRREADFHHPDVAQVQEALDGNRPANVADLAALTFGFLTGLARTIRDGNTNDWRQYWNPDQNSHRQPSRPIHEDHCRDRLLSDLQSRLEPLGIDAAPEGRYAGEKRSDIRVSYGRFNVPVEIKKSNHPNLWSAIRSQLIAKYTRDPGAGGYGIYLVFWFGKKCCQPPESRPCPGSAAELEKCLRDTLSPKEARMIKICVIDVAGPLGCRQDV